uniref:uncharacterized protein LOC122583574 n=1 Tax=Erigeron canadensis TaxID=72917 RepID=UPI001CB97D20|nr:uncharacterized protein LOC122583574 [Erigeron canadensis]
MPRKKKQAATRATKSSNDAENVTTFNSHVRVNTNFQTATTRIPLSDVTNTYSADRLRAANARKIRKNILSQKTKRSVMTPQLPHILTDPPLRNVRARILSNAAINQSLPNNEDLSNENHTNQPLHNAITTPSTRISRMKTKFYKGSSSTSSRNDDCDQEVSATPVPVIYNPYIQSPPSNGSTFRSSTRLSAGAYKLKGGNITSRSTDPVRLDYEDTDNDDDDVIEGISIRRISRPW